jgi:hypothetical protein
MLSIFFKNIFVLWSVRSEVMKHGCRGPPNLQNVSCINYDDSPIGNESTLDALYPTILVRTLAKALSPQICDL